MVALVAAGVGWLLVGFELLSVYVFVGREQSCSANRGDAYQSCVHGEDVSELVAEGIAVGLSAVGLVVLFRGRRRRVNPQWDSTGLTAVSASGSLAAVCVALWVHGSLGGWEPERPFPYEPVALVWGHTAMVIGVGVGLLVGVLIPLGREPTLKPGPPDEPVLNARRGPR